MRHPVEDQIMNMPKQIQTVPSAVREMQSRLSRDVH